MKGLKKYTKSTLNLERFTLVAVWPQNAQEAVFLFRERGKPPEMKPWSVQWRGNGHYFQTIGETVEYCKSRGFKITAEVENL